MSQLLESLLAEIGDPNREDLLQITPLVFARLRELPHAEQLKLRRDVTEIRKTLTHATDAWYSHNIVFQFLWKLTGVLVPETEEQKALREKIRRDYLESNGDWYAKGTWLTPDEVAERMERRAAELMREDATDAC